MKIIYFETSEVESSLNKADMTNLDFKGSEFQFFSEKLDANNVGKAKDAEVISVFINSAVDKEIIDALPKLKLIVTRSTGYDHIDTAYAVSKGIAVCNVPAYGSRTVAEFAFALMLALSRKLFSAAMQVKQQHNFDLTNFEGFNLQNKTLGVVGTGRIGQEVIKIAKGFDLKVLGYDPFPNEAKAQQLGFTYVSLDELLAASDVVTLHVPYIKETHHLINKDNILKFKKGALLVNTSRGEVLDNEAVLMGIKNKILAGVGLDVIEGEHDIKEEAFLLESGNTDQQKLKILLEDHVLMDLPEVILTPHIAFDTHEARSEIRRTSFENITAFLNGAPKNTVKI